MRLLLLTLCCALSFSSASLFAQDRDIKNVVVFQQEGRFAGWPANFGIWSWGDEILVGFTDGVYLKNPTGGHDVSRDEPSITRQARSLDGGETWTVEEKNWLHDQEKMHELTEAIDFSNPEVALNLKGDKIYYSKDKGKSWAGPYQLPTFGRPDLLSRTDYIIEGPKQVTAFTTATKQNGKEGQPLCMRTNDGGLTWKLVGWIMEEPAQDYGYAIMPATVSLNENSYLSIIRRGGRIDGKKQWWLETFLSPDKGMSWYELKDETINNAGNPATLTRLDDNRLAMVYGFRRAPYGIRAKISEDNGQSWGREMILRGDSASWDIGYPRTVKRPDGKLVSIYYYHTEGQAFRFIGCTIWDPENAWY
ncbi:BNR/Asp-box repeat protein [Polystyrenella longa]|uniref:BNR/Asp-box repeat protein n=1 Tax=Polystyrenella longa TaxID=2528007 RepID=A0A518CHF1_9PLAN|nr:sialidase family protein [Polystyrenella longa]QDU78656.1 BNR/Asp-box repeat protein [Polystyrenella longa]